MALLRVRHCRALLYCRRAPPARCPACGGDLRAAGLAAAPVRLPCPFRHGHGQPRAFLIRPTRGTFLHGYDGHSDLHVGITNSQGVVYNYDQEGVHRAGSGWEQCISIPLVQPDMSELLQQWDDLLEEFSLEEAWLPHSPKNKTERVPWLGSTACDEWNLLNQWDQGEARGELSLSKHSP
ncbi:MKRN2 opposite strand protein isoform X2 [Corvus kubaryi]|uniref:MKRN2 opposite strand protein isoform X2 n=1 Tax=Corvus kubaryi TaxID=68294 RepID=UPI001C049F48|nr:MKRN2 opposite strand protein isoform X2 [Corvus kubaryi]